MRLSGVPLLVFLLLLTACEGDPDTPPTARPVMVVQPMQAAVRMSAYAGEVRARQESPLAFRVGGKVSKRLVDSGDQVKAGQPLAELVYCNRMPAKRNLPPLRRALSRYAPSANAICACCSKNSSARRNLKPPTISTNPPKRVLNRHRLIWSCRATSWNTPYCVRRWLG